jgi:hypothetical protein
MLIDDIQISICEIFFVNYTRLDASGKSNILSARGKKTVSEIIGVGRNAAERALDD